MRLMLICLSLFPSIFSLRAAELSFDWSRVAEGELPPGWRATLTGGGDPAKWAVVQDEVPSAFERFSELAPAVNRRPVIAQLSDDQTDERFPLLIYQEEEFGDFTLATKFKTVAGETEQMAGVAFRIVDEKNYHVVRASSRGGTFLFYSFINGQRTQPFGVNAAIPSNVWHTLEIEARATKFSFKLNGQQLMPVLDNPNFRRGKIGYWTKSDSISHFVDTRITYQPTVIQAQRLVNSALEQFDRLIALRVLLPGEQAGSTKIIAGTDPKEIDQPGIAEERLVIDTGEFMYLVGDGEVTVTLPLKDRNGEIIAALRTTMKRFRGQTQKNAVIRAQPVAAHFQNRLFDYEDLFE